MKYGSGTVYRYTYSGVYKPLTNCNRVALFLASLSLCHEVRWTAASAEIEAWPAWYTGSSAFNTNITLDLNHISPDQNRATEFHHLQYLPCLKVFQPMSWAIRKWNPAKPLTPPGKYRRCKEFLGMKPDATRKPSAYPTYQSWKKYVRGETAENPIWRAHALPMSSSSFGLLKQDDSMCL